MKLTAQQKQLAKKAGLAFVIIAVFGVIIFFIVKMFTKPPPVPPPVCPGGQEWVHQMKKCMKTCSGKQVRDPNDNYMCVKSCGPVTTPPNAGNKVLSTDLSTCMTCPQKGNWCAGTKWNAKYPVGSAGHWQTCNMGTGDCDGIVGACNTHYITAEEMDKDSYNNDMIRHPPCGSPTYDNSWTCGANCALADTANPLGPGPYPPKIPASLPPQFHIFGGLPASTQAAYTTGRSVDNLGGTPTCGTEGNTSCMGWPPAPTKDNAAAFGIKSPSSDYDKFVACAAPTTPQPKTCYGGTTAQDCAQFTTSAACVKTSPCKWGVAPTCTGPTAQDCPQYTTSAACAKNSLCKWGVPNPCDGSEATKFDCDQCKGTWTPPTYFPPTITGAKTWACDPVNDCILAPQTGTDPPPPSKLCKINEHDTTWNQATVAYYPGIATCVPLPDDRIGPDNPFYRGKGKGSGFNALYTCPTTMCQQPDTCDGGSKPGADCTSDTDCPKGGTCKQGEANCCSANSICCGANQDCCDKSTNNCLTVTDANSTQTNETACCPFDHTPIKNVDGDGGVTCYLSSKLYCSNGAPPVWDPKTGFPSCITGTDKSATIQSCGNNLCLSTDKSGRVNLTCCATSEINTTCGTATMCSATVWPNLSKSTTASAAAKNKACEPMYRIFHAL